MKIQYIQRTRDYYRAQGFEQDYSWAENTATPFQPLLKPLADCVVTLVTTAVTEPEIPKPSRAAKRYRFDDTPAAFDTSDLSWDKTTTHTRDRGSYFPMEILRDMVNQGTIGALADHYHFVPTEYSQANTLNKDAPAIVKACIQDEVDVAILIPL
ncbi:MAG: hypothetical protein VYA08_02015 [Pseudomonadota bacterium]|nr:hypothetical protein [Pseudomonadota bacterium]